MSPPQSGGALPAVLAIDGGNSKTDAALVAADGTLLASVRGPGVPSKLTLDQMVGVLGSVAEAAVTRAHLPPAAPGTRIARHLSACVANADLPEEEQELTEALRAEGWTDTTHVANDTFAVLRAGLDGPAPHWGVGVTCGAGINCVGVAPDGQTTRFLSLGSLTGDWGGGYGLGTEGHLVGDPRRGRPRAADRADASRWPPTSARPACTVSRWPFTPGSSAVT